MKRRRQRGFTLIEIMVVVVIIGILAALVITQIGGRADDAKKEATKAMITQIDDAIEFFKIDHNRYPERLDDLLSRPAYVDSNKWRKGGYLKKKPLDGWGREFVFRVPGSGDHSFDVISFGADGREGGQGYDEDLKNHD